MIIDRLGYIVGVMLGDGSFGKRDGEDVNVQMNVKDREFADRFARALSEIVSGQVRVYEYERHPNEWGNGMKYVVCKGMKEKISELKWWMEHVVIRRMPRGFKLGVISGLFDSEGCLSENSNGSIEYPRIIFEACDIDLVKLWQVLCVELFGLNSSINGPSVKGSYSVKYNGVERCSKFFMEIPITIDRKRERWQQFLAGLKVSPYV